MPKVQQQKSAKVQSMLHEHAYEFTSTPKGEIFCKWCDCLKSVKWQKVYGGSTSPQSKASKRFISWNSK